MASLHAPDQRNNQPYIIGLGQGDDFGDQIVFGNDRDQRGAIGAVPFPEPRVQQPEKGVQARGRGQGRIGIPVQDVLVQGDHRPQTVDSLDLDRLPWTGDG